MNSCERALSIIPVPNIWGMQSYKSYSTRLLLRKIPTPHFELFQETICFSLEDQKQLAT